MELDVTPNSMFGEKNFGAVVPKYPTPADIPEELGCRQFSIPASTAWFALIMGCLMQLTEEENWQAYTGGVSVEDAAATAQLIIDSGYEDGVCGAMGNIQTPFWDDATDTDDEYSVAEQPWYGEVDDPELPADELTFIENAGIWAFTGLLAFSGTPAAAILFNTSAPSFVLAMRGDDFSQVIRVIVDAHDQVTVETTGDPDELLQIPLVGDPTLETHDVLVILKELL